MIVKNSFLTASIELMVADITNVEMVYQTLNAIKADIIDGILG